MEHDYRAHAVPEVVQRIDALGDAARLIGGLHKRTAQFDGAGQVFAAELVAEAEIVPCRQRIHVAARTDYVSVSAHNCQRLGVPDDKLAVNALAHIQRVDIDLVARAAASRTERLLAQASHLAHKVGAACRLEGIYLVGGMARAPHEGSLFQLVEQDTPVDGSYYSLDHTYIAI